MRIFIVACGLEYSHLVSCLGTEGHEVIGRGDPSAAGFSLDRQAVESADLVIVASASFADWTDSIPRDFYPKALVMDTMGRPLPAVREKVLALGFLDVVDFSYNLTRDTAAVQEALAELAAQEEHAPDPEKVMAYCP